MTSGVFVIDPLADPRWESLLERHPCASVFHSRGWLQALNRTYGYEPVALTTTSGGPLETALVFCSVPTLMSRRLVSLPFSDHCDPLAHAAEELSTVLRLLKRELKEGRWTSLELRPRYFAPFGLPGSSSYYLHTLDLARPAEEIFQRFHHSSTQRAIRRAERESLTYQAGTSEQLLSSFYGLLRQARRRHGLPPQPLAWFRNLIAFMGNDLTIHVASKGGQAIAAILTLSFKRTIVYKYGGSDARHHSRGGMPFLFWRAIQDATVQGFEKLDLGRSDVEQSGLVTFKEHLGATRLPLTYYTLPYRLRSTHVGVVSRVARGLLAHLPCAALDLTGRLLYRHLG